MRKELFQLKYRESNRERVHEHAKGDIVDELVVVEIKGFICRQLTLITNTKIYSSKVLRSLYNPVVAANIREFRVLISAQDMELTSQTRPFKSFSCSFVHPSTITYTYLSTNLFVANSSIHHDDVLGFCLQQHSTRFSLLIRINQVLKIRDSHI